MSYITHDFKSGDTLYASDLKEMDEQILKNATDIETLQNSGGNSTTPVGETYAGDLIGSVTIEAGEYSAGTDHVFNDVTVGKLREYKTFLLLFKGESNTKFGCDVATLLGNTTLCRQPSEAGSFAVFEWIDNARRYLRCLDFGALNPSLIFTPPVFTNNGVTSNSAAARYPHYGILDTLSIADDSSVKLRNKSAATTTIVYNAYIYGMTKETTENF